MKSLNSFQRGLARTRIMTPFSLLMTLVCISSFLGSSVSLAVDFTIPSKGYKTQSCHTIKSSCESNCKDFENLSSCQNCCKRDWYVCLEVEGKAGKPGDVLQPDDLTEFEAKCGETLKSKIRKKAIDGIH